jgi:uncharacterized protein (DUF2384 family)
MTDELAEALAELAGTPHMGQLTEALARPVADLVHVVNQSSLFGRENRDAALLALTGVAQAFEDHASGPAIWASSSPADLLEWLSSSVSATREELAEWLGVSARTLARWKSQEAQPAEPELHRLRLLVRLASQLAYSYTRTGISQWLVRPMALIGGRRAVDVLSDEEAVRQLEGVAQGIR